MMFFDLTVSRSYDGLVISALDGRRRFSRLEIREQLLTIRQRQSFYPNPCMVMFFDLITPQVYDGLMIPVLDGRRRLYRLRTA